MKKILVLFVVLFLTACGAEQTVSLSRTTTDIMNTVCEITIFDMHKRQGDALLEKTITLMADNEALLSKTIDTSDIAHINKSAGKTVLVDPKTVMLINKALHYTDLSGGAFDSSIGKLIDLWDIKNSSAPPSDEDIEKVLAQVTAGTLDVTASGVMVTSGIQLDLGGIAKGYIADEAALYLMDQGVSAAILNFGGDILTIGQRPERDYWHIGIQIPFAQHEEIMATLQFKGAKAVVTSGIYERYYEYNGQIYHHILSPATGYPAQNDLLAVTVIADTAADADAAATACMVLGSIKGRTFIEALPGAEAVFVLKDNTLEHTSGIGEDKEIILRRD